MRYCRHCRRPAGCKHCANCGKETEPAIGTPPLPFRMDTKVKREYDKKLAQEGRVGTRQLRRA